MTATPRFSFVLWDEGNTEPNLLFNALAYAVDALLQTSVKDKDLSTPPGSPALGDAYIVAGSPTGAWSGKATQIAVAITGGWMFYAPAAGFQSWVADEAVRYVFNGSAWAVDASSGLPDAPTDGVSYVRQDAAWEPAGGVPVNAQTGTSYTLAQADSGGAVELTNASSITVTVPSGLSEDFNCLVCQMGAGAITLVNGSGVTLRNANDPMPMKTRGQYASLAVRSTATADTLVVDGFPAAS
jgi:hypothetical protein